MTRRDCVQNMVALAVGAMVYRPRLASGWPNAAMYLTHVVHIEEPGRPCSIVLTWRLGREANGAIAVRSLDGMKWCWLSRGSGLSAALSDTLRQYRKRWPSMSFTSADEAETVMAAVVRAEEYLFAPPMKVKSYSLPREWVEACRLEYDPPLMVPES